MKNKAKKSPLKAEPLRNPGQSLDEEINALWDDKGHFYIIFIIGFLVVAIVDWYRWITHTPINPVASTIIAVIVIVFCRYKLIGIKRKSNQLKLARDGEKVVGQYLDILREEGARILHDIKGENFNVDHVILSEHGIFVVDTKTHQKPIKSEARIRVQDDEVYVNNYKVDRNPIKQSRALTKWVQDLLEETTGKKFPVQGVVVFPGWFVEKMHGKEDVWVLNPKALPAFIRNSQQKIQMEDVLLAYFHLSRYVRLKF